MESTADYNYFKENKQNPFNHNYQQPHLTNHLQFPRQAVSEEEVEIPIVAQMQLPLRTWNSLCYIELESFGLSIFVLFHIIGKIGESVGHGYAFFYFVYLFLCFVFNYTFYIYSQLAIDVCPEKKTSLCLSETKEKCFLKYYSGANAYYPCSYNEEYQICYAENKECIDEDQYNFLIAAVVLLNIVSVGGICGINVYLRKIFKEQQMVEYNKWKDPLVAIFLMHLSLAQQYRDLDFKPNETRQDTSIQL